MKTIPPVSLNPSDDQMMRTPVTPPEQTIARTLAQHQSDPGHRFHARGQRSDGRVSVAAGERLQRVRGRAHGN